MKKIFLILSIATISLFAKTEKAEVEDILNFATVYQSYLEIGEYSTILDEKINKMNFNDKNEIIVVISALENNINYKKGFTK